MQMLINILPPIPPSIGQSYIPFGFYKFGLGCWQYVYGQGFVVNTPASTHYDGQIEWLNTQNYITEPKLPNSVGFRSWVQPGIIYQLTPIFQVAQNVPDISFNLNSYNPATGKGMPLVIP